MDKDSFRSYILGAVKAAVELRITTVVGDAKLDGPIAELKTQLEAGGKHQSIITSMNLIEGDIVTVISPDNITDERRWLRDFHEAQIKRGEDLVNRNLETLAKLGSSLLALVDSKS